MAEHLAAFVFATAVKVLDMSKEAKQCEVEVARIAVRTQNVLGTLEGVGGHFSDQVGLEASLLELKSVLENVQALVGRCGPSTVPKLIRDAVFQQSNPNKQALIDAERKLEAITQDLGLPMLAEIKQQLNRMQSESVALTDRNTEALAGVIRTEIDKAMMVTVEEGMTIKDAIGAKVARMEEGIYDTGQRDPPAELEVEGGAVNEQAVREEEEKCSLERWGSMVMKLGRVRFEDLKEQEILGKGAFGTVLLGTYQGREVAIKKVRGSTGSIRIIEAFRKEMEIQYAMRHPNIVEVVAFDLGGAGHPPCLVMERMRESLYDLLSVEGIDMGLVAKGSILRDVSKGMRFLHSRGILHRDLKSLNILLDDNWVAKVSDFGLAKVNTTIATVTGGTGFHSKVGSDFWMAPEIHSNRKATRASDVFSLHVVMWEENAGYGKPIGERLQTNPSARLPFVELECPDAVGSIIRSIADRCGYMEPSERPTMDEVCAVMTVVIDLLENPHQCTFGAVAPAPRRHLRQQESREQNTLQHNQHQNPERDQHPQQQAGDRRDPQQTQQEHIQRFSLRLPETDRGTAWRAGVGTGSSFRSLISIATPTTDSYHNWPSKPLPVSATPTVPTVPSEGSAQPVQRGGNGAQPLPPFDTSDSTTTEKRDDHTVLLKLFRQCSGHSLPDSPIAHLKGFKWTGWGTNHPLRTWYGVGATREQDGAKGRERVTSLVLPKNGLRGDLPEEVMTLDGLTKIDLKGNRLTGILTASIGNLRNLQTLDISRNKLTGIIPHELGDLVALTVLDLHGNSLHGEVPLTLGKLVRLKTMDISNCKLCGSIPKEFEKLQALRVLRLERNDLTGEIPKEIGHLTRLTRLSLGFCKLEGALPPELGQLRSLEHLILHDNNITGKIPKEIGQLTKLTRLSLGSCHLVGTLPLELGRLGSLEHLVLNNNKMTGYIPRALLKIPTLRTFHLENNKFGVRIWFLGGAGSARTIKNKLPKDCDVRL